MSLTVNTNMQALKIQSNLSSATTKMNNAMERMSSGSKINSAKDDAAGLAVSTTLQKTIGASKVATDNVKIGADLLMTAEGTLDVIMSNLVRVRDLTEQSANGTYSQTDKQGIASEVNARLTEIIALAGQCTFNGVGLFGGTAATSGITLQAGISNTDTITLSPTIFAGFTSISIGSVDLSGLSAQVNTGGTAASAYLASLDTAITNITGVQTTIGAAQNRLEAVLDGLDIQQTNLTSALSTIKDADVAAESANYVKTQILQQASASLLVQANSSPQIALTLIKGQ